MFAAASITNTSGKGSPREGHIAEMTPHLDRVLPISGGCTGGNAGAIRLQTNDPYIRMSAWSVSRTGQTSKLDGIIAQHSINRRAWGLEPQTSHVSTQEYQVFTTTSKAIGDRQVLDNTPQSDTSRVGHRVGKRHCP